MSGAFIVQKSGVDRLKNAVAIVGVEYPQGSVCICTNLIDKSMVLKAENKSGFWAFGVPVDGSWTISCTADDGNYVERRIYVVQNDIQYLNVEYLTPFEYQPVSYLYSKGSSSSPAFINTEYIPTSLMLSVAYQGYTRLSTFTAPLFVFGNYNASSKIGFAGGYNNSSSSYYMIAYGGADTFSYSSYRNVEWRSLGATGRELYLGGILMQKTTKTNRIGTSPIALFAGNIDGYKSATGVYMEELTIIDNGIKVAHFNPCYRKSDSMMGVWDTVRKRFFPVNDNAVFSKGSNKTSY